MPNEVTSLSQGSKHKVPERVPALLDLLRDDAQANGEELLGLILSSCTYEIEEEYTYDSWDNGMWGHALHLFVPREVFALFRIDDIPSYEEMIDERINKLIRTRNEYVDHVTIQVSAVVGSAPTPPPRAADTDLWGGEELLRLFVSHVAAHKTDAHALKEACISLGISCFVAHDDIGPTAEWEKEILRALRSMDALVLTCKSVRYVLHCSHYGKSGDTGPPVRA